MKSQIIMNVKRESSFSEIFILIMEMVKDWEWIIILQQQNLMKQSTVYVLKYENELFSNLIVIWSFFLCSILMDLWFFVTVKHVKSNGFILIVLISQQNQKANGFVLTAEKVDLKYCNNLFCQLYLCKFFEFSKIYLSFEMTYKKTDTNGLEKKSPSDN